MSSHKEIIIVESADDLARKGALIFFQTALKGAEQESPTAIAISGGSTPRGMHRLLAEKPYISDTPWNKTHIFWVDERCVPADDPASNYGLAKRDLLDHVPIPPGHIHPMPGDVSPEEGAKIYQRELGAFFQPGQEAYPIFDLIVLGVGKDGHTASLFPGQEGVVASEGWVIAVKGGDPNLYRLTLTYDVLNRGKDIIFLVSGKDKAPIAKTLLEKSEARLPAQKIRPVDGRLTWILDKDAASLFSV